MKSILESVGTLKGTVIEDPVLEPYFILAEQTGGFAVNKKREDKAGKLRFSTICYPSRFSGCLEVIAQEKLHEEGKNYSSIQEYIDTWKAISSSIVDAYSGFGKINV